MKRLVLITKCIRGYIFKELKYTPCVLWELLFLRGLALNIEEDII